MSLIRAGEDTFNVAVDGPADAPWLVLSNSLGTTLHMWDEQVANLARTFRVLRYDARGHGMSVAAEGPCSLDQLGQDALRIMDALGIERAHWLGLSLGGMVGLWMLAHAPHRIDRAVLANSGPRMGTPEFWNARIRATRDGGMDRLAESVVARWFTPDFRDKHPDIYDRALGMVKATPPEGYAASCAAIRDMDLREAARAIRNPVLVLVGAHDPAAPPCVGRDLAESIPRGRLVTLNAAHLSNWEAGEAFTEAALQFLTAPPERASRAGDTSGRRPPARKTRKSPAKRAPAKKGAAKKAAKKAAAKKSPAKKAAAKKGSPKKSAAKKTAGKKTSQKGSPKKAAGKKRGNVKKGPRKAGRR